MKIYHTATQEDYDALMIELELQGHKFAFSHRPTATSIFDNYKENTHIFNEGGILSFSNSRYAREHHSDVQIIEYKAKGDKMDEKQFKQQSHDLVVNIVSTIGTFATNLELTDDDLAKTQELVKKFDENLTEFIDSRKPKFEIGDYIVNKDGGVKWIGEIIEVDGKRTMCNWYDVLMNKVKTNTSLWDKNSVHATPEEIAEYKAALNFHGHGRKPFEIKKGDLIRSKSKAYPYTTYIEGCGKKAFVSEGYELLKTAEELEKWLADEQ